MPDERERLVEAAVRPFGEDREAVAVAGEWLSHSIVEGEDACARRAIDRWSEVDARGKRGRWKWTVLAIAVLGVLFLVVPVIVSLVEIRDLAVSFSGASPWVKNRDPRHRIISAELPGKERLLLGDPALPEHDRDRLLWESEPENPAYFSEYAVSYISHHKSLPPDYAVLQSRLDPDNSWFDILAASVIGMDVVKRIPKTAAEKDANALQRWSIVDKDRHLEAISVLRKARGKTRYQRYDESVMESRIALLSQKDITGNLLSITYIAGMNDAGIKARPVIELLCARLGEIGETGDRDEFRELAADAEFLIGALSNGEDHLMIGEMVLVAGATAIYPALHDAALKLGLEDEYPLIRDRDARMRQYVDEKKRDAGLRQGQEVAVLLKTRGGLLANLMHDPMIFRQVRTAPRISPEDLKPARLAEHDALAVAATIMGIVTILLSLIAVILYRFRASGVVRILGARIEELLGPRDWTWILGGGVVLPIAWVIGIYVFTPLSERDFTPSLSVRENSVIQPFGYFCALAGLLIMLPLLIARWRLAIRARVFGFRGKSWLGWLVAAGLAAFVVACHPAKAVAGKWVALPVLFYQLWLMVVICRAPFSRSGRLLARVATARALFPAYAVALLCLVAVMAGFGISHRYWMARNTFTKVSSEFPGMSPYEYRVAKQFRKEIRQALDGS